MNKKIGVPFWFRIVAIVALLWNLMGIFVLYIQLFASPEMLVTISQVERDIIAAYPLWFNIAFGASVICGALGCISLMIKKYFALPLFVISFLGVAVQMTYTFILAHNSNINGPGGLIMPFMVVGISIFLIWYARMCIRKGWLA